MYIPLRNTLWSSAITYVLLKRDWKRLKSIRVCVCWGIIAYLVHAAIPTEKTLYQILDITTKCTQNDIQIGFRAASKRTHPDRNPKTPGAEKGFAAVKQAYDILIHDTRRSNYNRFGDHNYGDIDESRTLTVLVLGAVHQIILFCLGFLLSYPKPFNFSRQIFVVYNVGSFCLELQFRFIEDDSSFNWISWFGDLLPFERVHLLSNLFPAVLVFSMVWSDYIFIDRQVVSVFLLKALLSTNRTITERMQEVVRAIAYVRDIATSSTTHLKSAKNQTMESTANQLNTEIKGESTSTQLEVDGMKTIEANENSVEDWNALTDILTEGQMHLFHRIISEQYKRTVKEMREEEKTKKRFHVNWWQVLSWGFVIYVWVFYK